jgi:hypothetical protein
MASVAARWHVDAQVIGSEPGSVGWGYQKLGYGPASSSRMKCLKHCRKALHRSSFLHMVAEARSRYRLRLVTAAISALVGRCDLRVDQRRPLWRDLQAQSALDLTAPARIERGNDEQRQPADGVLLQGIPRGSTR